MARGSGWHPGRAGATRCSGSTSAGSEAVAPLTGHNILQGSLSAWHAGCFRLAGGNKMGVCQPKSKSRGRQQVSEGCRKCTDSECGNSKVRSRAATKNNRERKWGRNAAVWAACRGTRAGCMLHRRNAVQRGHVQHAVVSHSVPASAHYFAGASCWLPLACVLPAAGKLLACVASAAPHCLLKSRSMAVSAWFSLRAISHCSELGLGILTPASQIGTTACTGWPHSHSYTVQVAELGCKLHCIELGIFTPAQTSDTSKPGHID